MSLTLKMQAEQRSKYRAQCRTLCDNFIKAAVDVLNDMPPEQQMVTISMIQSELQALMKMLAEKKTKD